MCRHVHFLWNNNNQVTVSKSSDPLNNLSPFCNVTCMQSALDFHGGCYKYSNAFLSALKMENFLITWVTANFSRSLWEGQLKVHITLVPYVNKWIYRRKLIEHAAVSGVYRLVGTTRLKHVSNRGYLLSKSLPVCDSVYFKWNFSSIVDIKEANIAFFAVYNILCYCYKWW